MDFRDLRSRIAQIKAACLPPDVAVSYLDQVLRQFVSRTNLSPVKTSLESKGLYRRQQLSAPQDDFHIIVVMWKPYSSSPIHDHDETTGAVITLVGNTVETKYERVAPLGNYYFLNVKQTQVLDSKTVSPILPGAAGLQLHAMHNPTATWAATLHVYLHPLTRFNLYHPQACELYTQTSEKLWFDQIPSPLSTQTKTRAMALAH